VLPYQGSIRLEDGEIVCVLVGGWSLWQKKRKPWLFLILFWWIERGWSLKKHWFYTVSDFQLSLSGVSMYQHAMSVWFYIKSISRFPSQLVLKQLSVYWEEAFEMKVLPSDGLGIIIRENSLEIQKKRSYTNADLFKREVVHFPYHYPQGYSNAVGALLYMWAGIWVGEQIAQLIGWIDQRECHKTHNLLALQLIMLFQKAKSAATGCRRILQHPWRGGLLVAPPLVHGADAVVLSSWAIYSDSQGCVLKSYIMNREHNFLCAPKFINFYKMLGLMGK